MCLRGTVAAQGLGIAGSEEERQVEVRAALPVALAVAAACFLARCNVPRSRLPCQWLMQRGLPDLDVVVDACMPHCVALRARSAARALEVAAAAVAITL